MADPMGKTNKSMGTRVSVQRFLIAGLHVTVYGLSELHGSAKNVACLWMLHPRLADAQWMAPATSTFITAWNSTPNAAQLGLIGVTLDQRNHGTRLKKHIYNEAWRNGNESHAPDMFSAFHGTMLDTRQLIEYLPAYVFPQHERTIAHHLAFGVSLGGHAVWHCLMHEPRIRTGVVVIGAPDYALFMKDRARLSKRRSYMRGQGAQFFGSVDFPTALVEAIQRWDPAGVLLGSPSERGDMMHPRDPPSPEEQERVAALIRHHLGGKRIQCLSGAQDKLVPPHLGVPFMDWLKRAIGSGSSKDNSSSPTSDNPEWKASAGRGWMVSGNADDESTDQVPERWKGPDWRAGAGAGWMTGAGAGVSSSNSRTLGPGWAGNTGIVIEDIHFDGAGHEMTPSMVAEATRFIIKALDEMVGSSGSGSRNQRQKARL